VLQDLAAHHGVELIVLEGKLEDGSHYELRLMAEVFPRVRDSTLTQIDAGERQIGVVPGQPVRDEPLPATGIQDGLRSGAVEHCTEFVQKGLQVPLIQGVIDRVFVVIG
jgi:hypothetical protein